MELFTFIHPGNAHGNVTHDEYFDERSQIAKREMLRFICGNRHLNGFISATLKSTVSHQFSIDVHQSLICEFTRLVCRLLSYSTIYLIFIPIYAAYIMALSESEPGLNQFVSSSGGMNVSQHGTSVNLDGESFRHLISSVFNTENFGKILKYGTVIAVACVIAKVAKDRWHRPPDDPAPDKVNAALVINRGKYTVVEDDTKIFVNRRGAEGVPLEYHGPSAEASVKRTGGEIHYTDEAPNDHQKND